jgi:hypothetical protein
MGVAGKPIDWSLRCSLKGKFRQGPSQPWMDCETVQYNTVEPITRVFLIRIRMAGFIPVTARDTFIGGKGNMLVKIMSLFTVEDGKGIEYDIGELVTYLNDLVFMMPTALFYHNIVWTDVDDHAFQLTMKSGGIEVSAKVTIDDEGAPVDFYTTDRFYYDQDGDHSKLVRTPWITPTGGWKSLDDRKIPTFGKAAWLLPEGEMYYADFTLEDGGIGWNVPKPE